MSLAACAALVERADPDRFLATMAAPVAARARLWPLYAYNIEIARAPWASAEPLVAEMRLQWWVDTAGGLGQGTRHPAHEIAGPLADLVAETDLPAGLLAGMAEARRADLSPAPFADPAALSSYLDATAGNLMWCAALALGAPLKAEAPVRAFGRASGLAAYLQAVPELLARGRHPLPDTSPDAIAALARDGLALVARARADRHAIPRDVAPAMYAGWQAAPILRLAVADPARVLKGGLARSEFLRRSGLLRRVLTGRW